MTDHKRVYNFCGRSFNTSVRSPKDSPGTNAEL